ncbi:MAG TPA: hypothetical protein VIO60_07830 [Rectinemataceae bacterium]
MRRGKLFLVTLLFSAATILLAASCSTASPVVLQLEKQPEAQAKVELAGRILSNLEAFGNNLAKAMIRDYRYVGLVETQAGAVLYRYDSLNPALPKHAYLVLRLEGSPSITTNKGDKNYILLDSGSIGLVPTDAPAVPSASGLGLAFTTTGYREAFNPFVIGQKGSYPEQILLWFKDPATKDRDMWVMASLLKSAFPRIRYSGR